jgi:hypothetical protein
MPRRLLYGSIGSGGYNLILLSITRHLSDVLELGQLRYRDTILLTIQCKQIGTSFTYAHGH